jgi:hypothetical protein
MGRMGRWRRGRARSVPSADLAELRRRMIEMSVPLEEAFPRGTPIAGRIAPRSEWAGFRTGSLDDFVAEAVARGAPPPRAVVFRGLAAAALGGLVAVPWRGGVLVGRAEAVGRAMDRGDAGGTTDGDGL